MRAAVFVVCAAFVATLAVIVIVTEVAVSAGRSVVTHNITTGNSSMATYTLVSHAWWIKGDSVMSVMEQTTGRRFRPRGRPSTNTFTLVHSGVNVTARLKVISAEECAALAQAKQVAHFSYAKMFELCLLHPPPTHLARTMSNTNWHGSLRSPTVSLSCPPRANATTPFMGSFRASSGKCSYFAPQASKEGVVAGWVQPLLSPAFPATKPVFPPSNGSITRVDVFVTAHQDDHELFMAPAVMASLRSPTSKGVFVYTTAGDAGLTNGWWEAREAGTLAATALLVREFGLFSPNITADSIVLVGGRFPVRRVAIGNAIHYMLRIREGAFRALMRNNQPAAILNQPDQFRYANISDIHQVLTGIIQAETDQVATINVHGSEYENAGRDHDLHVSTGRALMDVVAAHPRWSRCATRTLYTGYQHWTGRVNMDEPMRSMQRRMWLALSTTAEAAYAIPNNDLWSYHANHLGRMYVSRKLRDTQEDCA